MRDRCDEQDVTDRYTIREEVAHVATHGLGFILASVGATVLVFAAAVRGSARDVAGCGVFAAALLALYGASTLYHGVQRPRMKRRLRRLDHAAVYLLIAGTYTPFALVSLWGAWGWTLLGLVWAAAGVGIAIELRDDERLRRLSVPLGLGMGWLALVAIGPLLHSLGPGGLRLLVLGGLAYTVGVLFYVSSRIPYHHAVWHVFALAGSVFHFACVLDYVLPPLH